MIFAEHYCSRCERRLYDGDTVYPIGGELICDDCISDLAEMYEEEYPIEDFLVDCMRDEKNGF